MSLSLENVSFSVRGKPLIRAISFDVKPGAVTTIVGPNGAGKSTALQLLCGDIQPDGGSVLINGTPLSDVSPMAQARLRAVLPQSSNLVFRFRAAEIVAMGCMPHGEPFESTRRNAIIEEAMHMAACWDLRDRDFTTLSGGEQQRVQMARVIAQISHRRPCDQARYLLLDEPTSALDLVHQLVVMRAVKLFAEMGYGVAVVLHDLNLALAYADQLFVLDQGSVCAQGKPEEVLDEKLVESIWGIPVDLIVLPDQGGHWIRPRLVG